MDAVSAQQIKDLFGGGDSGGAPVGAPSFGDTLKKTIGMFPEIPMPKPNPNQGKANAEIAKEAAGVQDLESFKGFTPPPPPPDISKDKPIDQHFSSPFDAFKSVIPVFSIFASLASRHPLQTAMTSMAASMDAFHKGEIEEFQQQRENSKANLDYAIQAQKLNNDYYTAVHDNEKLSIEEKQNLIATHAKMAQDYIVAGAGNYKEQFEAVKAQIERTKAAADVAEKAYKDQQTSGMLTPEKYEQYRNDPAMQLALKAYMVSGNARSALGGGIFGGKDMGQKVEALQRMAIEKNPNFNPAIASLTMQGHQKELNTVETSSGKISLASNILSTSLPSLQQAAAKLNLSDVKGINNIYNAARSQMNDADFKNFSTQMRAVATDYGQFIGRTTGTVHSDEEALRILNEGMSDKSLQGFADAVETERGNVQAGMEKTLADIVKASGGGSETPSQPVNLVDKYGLEK